MSKQTGPTKDITRAVAMFWNAAHEELVDIHICSMHSYMSVQVISTWCRCLLLELCWTKAQQFHRFRCW